MTPDLIAASRVSRRVDVAEIRLTDVQLASDLVSATGDLRFESEHAIRSEVTDGKIEVECDYTFTFHTHDVSAFTLRLVYNVLYALQDDDATDENDVQHFADANGRYHTWPFVREMVTSLTAKMGYRPYVLPALSFSPKVEEDDSEPAPAIEEEAVPSDTEAPADELAQKETG